jgi:hypothetical protein
LVGMAEPSTRAKWRAPRSARVSTLKKCLTAPTLSETPGFDNYRAPTFCVMQRKAAQCYSAMLIGG